MSAALQFPNLSAAAAAQRRWHATGQFDARPHTQTPEPDPAMPHTGFGPASQRPTPEHGLPAHQFDVQPLDCPTPPPNLAFYRKHTETLLRRYLCASMLVGRSPSIFTENIGRGRAASQQHHTFEDCVIFVLDMEKALARISALDRLLLNRLVLQEYTVAETALLLNKSHRIVNLRLADALDRLTGILLDNGTLKIPVPRKPHQDCDLED
jgi:hypothetical protein